MPKQANQAQSVQYKTDSAEEAKKSWWHSFICEMKITDALIATFTLWLAVVTAGLIWMSVRQETMARVHERAYIFGGGPWGRTELMMMDGTAKYSDTVHMTIQNYGRTTGYVTKVQWGLCPGDQYPRDVQVSEIFDKRLLSSHTRVVAHPDDIYPPTGRDPLLYRQVAFKRSEHIGEVFFGRIFFKDIFGDSHYTTFKLFINKETADPLPGCYSDDGS